MSDKFAHYPSLEGQMVLVTGGANGIGASIVEHFAAQKATIAFIDKDEEAGAKQVSRLKDLHATDAWFRAVDLTDVDSLKRAIAAVHQDLGACKVLVNNAANDDRHEIDKVTPEYWDDRIAVNLKHQFFTAQAVYPSMIAAGGGSIINMSSISWMTGLRQASIYNIAKAGIVGLTKSLARELGAHKIRANCILPGAVATERQLEKWWTPELVTLILDSQCLKENLYPADIARLILWLAADDSRLVTNQSFIIDGGWS